MLLKRFLKENHVLTLPGRLAIILPVLSSFIFLLPVSGPMEWSAEKLPKGLKLDSKTGIITGSVASKGEYTVTLKAKNALGTSTEKLVIRIGDDLLLTPPMGWNSWNTFGRHLTEELVLQTADALVANGMRV